MHSTFPAAPWCIWSRHGGDGGRTGWCGSRLLQTCSASQALILTITRSAHAHARTRTRTRTRTHALTHAAHAHMPERTLARLSLMWRTSGSTMERGSPWRSQKALAASSGRSPLLISILSLLPPPMSTVVMRMIARSSARAVGQAGRTMGAWRTHWWGMTCSCHACVRAQPEWGAHTLPRPPVRSVGTSCPALPCQGPPHLRPRPPLPPGPPAFPSCVRPARDARKLCVSEAVWLARSPKPLARRTKIRQLSPRRPRPRPLPVPASGPALKKVGWAWAAPIV
jgi:hypothetical protein